MNQQQSSTQPIAPTIWYLIKTRLHFWYYKYWTMRRSAIRDILVLKWDHETSRFWITVTGDDSHELVIPQPGPILPSDLGFSDTPRIKNEHSQRDLDEKRERAKAYAEDGVLLPSEVKSFVDDGSIKLPEIPFEPLYENKEEWVSDSLHDEPFVPKRLNLVGGESETISEVLLQEGEVPVFPPDPIVKTEEDGSYQVLAHYPPGVEKNLNLTPEEAAENIIRPNSNLVQRAMVREALLQEGEVPVFPPEKFDSYRSREEIQSEADAAHDAEHEVNLDAQEGQRLYDREIGQQIRENLTTDQPLEPSLKMWVAKPKITPEELNRRLNEESIVD